MKSDNTKRIDQYLAGELSAEETKQFEKELKENEALREEVEVQSDLYSSIARLSTRGMVEDIGKSYHFNLLIKWVVIGLVISAIILSIFYAFVLNQSENNRYSQQNKETFIERVDNTLTKGEDELKEKSEVQAEETTHVSTPKRKIWESEGLINTLPVETFEWEGGDTAFISKNGVIISVPDEALILNGKPFNGKAKIEWQEALDASTIMKGGLSTMADSNLLETQGMFTFHAESSDGQSLRVEPSIGIYVQVPVDEIKSGMQLYDGECNEDSIINWVDPKPLEKLPVSAPMSELDFYPKGYEDTLDKLKLNQDKKYRDSLYLACEYEPESAQSFLKQEVFTDSEDTIPAVDSDRRESTRLLKGGFSFKKLAVGNGSIKGIVMDKESKRVIPSATVKVLKNERIQFQTTTDAEGAFQLSSVSAGSYSLDFDAMGYEQLFMDRVEVSAEKITFIDDVFLKKKDIPESEQIGIPPSKVLAFWKKEFNNTILATKDFEKRMRIIHSTCDVELLNIYTENLDKPLYYMDSLAVNKGYNEFESFFAERIGKVEVTNKHIKNLKNIYKRGIKNLKEDLKRQREESRREDREFSERLAKERVEQAIRTRKMKNQTLNSEIQFNLKREGRGNSANTSQSNFSFRRSSLVVSKQLTRSVGFRINRNNAIKNVDRKVADATRSRSNFKGEYNGKTINVKYDQFSLNVESYEAYSKLFCYLIPERFDSYIRLTDQSGSFKYKLNQDLKYNLIVFGLNANGFFYYSKKGVKKGHLSNIKLHSVSERIFERKLNQLSNSKLSSSTELDDELIWLKLEKEKYERDERQLRRDQFLNRIRSIVFACDYGSSDSFEVVPFPDVEAQFPGGVDAQKKFISENIVYPASAMERGIQGKVFVQYNVEKDGIVSDVKIMKGINDELNSEAVKVVRSFPKHIPAKINGVPARSVKTVNVTFSLN